MDPQMDNDRRGVASSPRTCGIFAMDDDANVDKAETVSFPSDSDANCGHVTTLIASPPLRMHISVFVALMGNFSQQPPSGRNCHQTAKSNSVNGNKISLADFLVVQLSG